MSATDFDLLVVGASFGGAACAIAAASAGLRVCVLERKRDPGERLHTTGIVVREAAEQTLLDQRLFMVPGSQYQAILNLLDRPESDNPGLSDLQSRRPVWAKK